MYIVKHKPTGLFFKKHNRRNRTEPVLAEQSKARVYRTEGAAKISVGNWIYLKQEERKGRNFGYYFLDESIWKIVEISLEIKPRRPVTVRIEVSWERMLELLHTRGLEEFEAVSTEEELNRSMGWGRNCFSCHISDLNADEIQELNDSGFEDRYDGEILLVVLKETYPGKYMIGEF
jgi:hypothetical protein